MDFIIDNCPCRRICETEHYGCPKYKGQHVVFYWTRTEESKGEVIGYQSRMFDGFKEAKEWIDSKDPKNYWNIRIYRQIFSNMKILPDIPY